VTNASTGAPVPGVLVCAFVSAGEIDECAVTGATGEYTIAGLPTGVYEVGFNGGKAYGIQFYSGASSFAGARPVSVTTGSTDGGIDATLRPVGTSSPPTVWTPPIGIGAAAGSGSAGAAGSGSAGASGGVLGATATRSLAVEIGALLRHSLTPEGRAARLASLLAGGGYTVAFRALSAGTAVIDWYQVPPSGKLARKTSARPVLVASGQMRFSAAGTARIKVRLTREGRRLIKRDKTVKLTAKGTFTPSGGKPIGAIEGFVLKR
jgi:hypothetical protein